MVTSSSTDSDTTVTPIPLSAQRSDEWLRKQTQNPLLTAALEYSKRGWKTFPVNGKIPLPRTRGVLDATADPVVINSWTWGGFDGIALATGTGLVVLDVDPKNGGPESLAELESKYGSLPRTLSTITPSGGSHYFFTSSMAVRNSASKLGAGIDIRGDGGYVVVPPSPNYGWDIGVDEVAELPMWVRGMLSAPAVRTPVEHASLREGGRNAGLASLAGTLRRRPEISFEAYLGALHVFNDTDCNPPLERREVEQIARSIWRYDTNSPGRGESRHQYGTGVRGQGSNGNGLPEGGALRRPRKPRGFFDGARYLGRGR